MARQSQQRKDYLMRLCRKFLYIFDLAGDDGEGNSAFARKEKTARRFISIFETQVYKYTMPSMMPDNADIIVFPSLEVLETVMKRGRAYYLKIGHVKIVLVTEADLSKNLYGALPLNAEGSPSIEEISLINSVFEETLPEQNPVFEES